MSDLIDVAGLREHITTGLSDEALQDIIDYNDAAIVARAGPMEQHTTLLFPAETATIIQLGAPATIASIKEWWSVLGYETTLDDTDYFNDLGTLRRRGDGNHPYTYWNAPVQIVWDSADETATRKMVLVQLCKLDVNHNPGLASFRVGQHEETYANSVTEPGYAAKREELLGQLVNPQIPPVFA